MRANSFGRYYGFTAFGESHGDAVGLVIEDVLPGVDFPLDAIQALLDKRRPATGTTGVSSRKEPDRIQVLSGVFEGKTTGMPICLLVRNTDHDPGAYEAIRDTFRPGHADYAWFRKFKIWDHRGGGRASGRETIARVAASGMVLEVTRDIEITAYPVQIGEIRAAVCDRPAGNEYCWPDPNSVEQVRQYLRVIGEQGDSVGALVQVRLENIPAGLGDPVFDKLDANLAHAMLSIGGVKGIAFGDGFLLSGMRGSEANDPMVDGGFQSNRSGGILGGVSTGNTVEFRIVLKPVPSISLTQKTMNRYNENVNLSLTGRWDVCLVPRILPVVESMTRLVLADAISHQKLVSNTTTALVGLREQIDKVDDDLLLAIYRRMQISARIGEIKKREGIPVVDSDREAIVFDRLTVAGAELGLQPEMIRAVWKILVQKSREKQ